MQVDASTSNVEGEENSGEALSLVVVPLPRAFDRSRAGPNRAAEDEANPKRDDPTGANASVTTRANTPRTRTHIRKVEGGGAKANEPLVKVAKL